MIGEFLAFFVQLADRVGLPAARRRVAGACGSGRRQAPRRILEDNQLARLGPARRGKLPVPFRQIAKRAARRLCHLRLRRRADFPTLRYLGNRIMDLMGRGDQSWINRPDHRDRSARSGQERAERVAGYPGRRQHRHLSPSKNSNFVVPAKAGSHVIYEIDPRLRGMTNY